MAELRDLRQELAALRAQRDTAVAGDWLTEIDPVMSEMSSGAGVWWTRNENNSVQCKVEELRWLLAHMCFTPVCFGCQKIARAWATKWQLTACLQHL